MALRAQTLFLYGYQITTLNNAIDFKAVSGGPQLNASLTLGYYSLTDLMAEVKRALQAADPLRTYTVTADRTISGGTQNRVTISSNGSFFSLLFASGTRASSSAASILGFAASDHTGALTYTGVSTSGTTITSTLTGYNYLSPNHMRKVFGSLNISTTGQKEAIVYQIQQFFQIQFKYEPQTKVDAEWMPFLTWCIQQRPFETTPEITSPTSFYNCTLETSSGDGKGLGYTLKEMLPEMPFLYDLGVMKFRVKT